MIGRHYIRDSQGRHGNEVIERKVRYVEWGLLGGIVLSVWVGAMVLSGPIEWYYDDWTWFWGCLMLWLVV